MSIPTYEHTLGQGKDARIVASMAGDADVTVYVAYAESDNVPYVIIDTEEHAKFRLDINDGAALAVFEGGRDVQIDPELLTEKVIGVMDPAVNNDLLTQDDVRTALRALVELANEADDTTFLSNKQDAILGKVAELVQAHDEFEERIAEQAALKARDRTEVTVFRWTLADLDAYAGREVTADEAESIAVAISNSTAGDAVDDAVRMVLGGKHDDDEED